MDAKRLKTASFQEIRTRLTEERRFLSDQTFSECITRALAEMFERGVAAGREFEAKNLSKSN
ncbi:hypothetical protein FF100_04795 [Methylobacterium terricola]|uniref:Uncharacterized protein n=1 Tax=Methylobacterium terricola TaxID=2583531 RepID=A0A5C4LK78_9HYPH|nr:hypothetical protein [Methylobacterium terricola]TNC14896.1 hypothetical protein FF100_04795 [Methylobacterium terricola]